MPRTPHPSSPQRLVHDTSPPQTHGLPVAKLFEPHPLIISTLRWTGHICQLTNDERVVTIMSLGPLASRGETKMMHDQALMYHPTADIVRVVDWEP